MADIVIKFPTRNRPQKFQQIFLQYLYMVSGNNNVSFIISMDEDDKTMNTPNMRKFLNKFKNVSYYYGNSKSKIEAINADLDKLPPKWDILLLASDDMVPKQVSYDQIIVNAMSQYFPNLDGVLHFNDGRQREGLNTFCIIGRKYFERFGYIYYPGYTSVYCDNEFTDVSILLNKTKYFQNILFFHGWVNFIGNDELYLRNENPKLYEKDAKLYQERKARNFDLK